MNTSKKISRIILCMYFLYKGISVCVFALPLLGFMVNLEVAHWFRLSSFVGVLHLPHKFNFFSHIDGSASCNVYKRMDEGCVCEVVV